MNLETDLSFISLTTCCSTNDVLYSLALNNIPNGTVVTADFQTNAKGTNGRRFYSFANDGLYMSILLRNLSFDKLSHLTQVSAVAVSDVLNEIFSCNTKIKPLNDVYVNDKKVCGILIENRIVKSEVLFSIVGIGINLFKNQNTFPDEIKDKAAWISDEYNKERKLFCQRKIAQTILLYSEKIKDENFLKTIYNRYEKRKLIL